MCVCTIAQSRGIESATDLSNVSRQWMLWHPLCLRKTSSVRGLSYSSPHLGTVSQQSLKEPSTLSAYASLRTSQMTDSTIPCLNCNKKSGCSVIPSCFKKTLPNVRRLMEVKFAPLRFSKARPRQLLGWQAWSSQPVENSQYNPFLSMSIHFLEHLRG